MDSSQKHLLNTLVMRLLDGELESEQAVTLDRLLRDHPDHLHYFATFLRMQSVLYGQSLQMYPETNELEQTCSLAGKAMSLQEEERLNRIKEQAERELERYLMEQERLLPTTDQSHQKRIQLQQRLFQLAKRTQGVLSVVWHAAKYMSVAAAILFVLVLSIQAYRLKRVVAVVGDQVHAQWLTDADSNELRPGLYVLEKGFAQLHFKRGSNVLMQAPCEFKLLSPNRMHLFSGRVTAYVPPEAHGFRIDTDEGAVIDYGTEFGVGVGQQLDVHVFEGEVALNTSTLGKQGVVQQPLRAGQTARVVTGQKPAIGFLSDQPALFTRSLPDPNQVFGIPGVRIDLADIIGGGNGFGTGKKEAGIDLVTGEPTLELTYGNREGTPGFRKVKALPYVDGVFIPDGAAKPVVTSTRGYPFEQCAPTSKEYWSPISNSAYVLVPEYRGRFNEGYAILGEQRYGIPEHPVIIMSANSGITFDLERIREDIQGSRISVFRAVYGISDTLEIFPDVGDADVWILIDGEPKFVYRPVRLKDEPHEIYVPIQNEDRFLTLIVSDHDQDINVDVVLFGDPALFLEQEE